MLRALGPELTARLDPTYPADNPVVTQEAWSGDGLAIVEQIDAVRRSMGLAAEASGSNNWAVSGALSATGAPLIAGDPHLPPSMPGIWYQVGLRHGDRFVRGASMPGMPGVYMGQNNDVCWTFTNVMADVQDLFVERIEGDSYLFEDEWRPLRDGARGDRRQGPRRAGRARRADHPPRPDRQRGARRRRGRAAGAELAGAARTDRLRRHVRAARDRLRPGAGRQARGPHGAGLEPDLGRPPRLDRLQADRPPAAAPRRLPRPAEAGLDAASSSGRGRSPTTSCRRWSTPRAAT